MSPSVAFSAAMRMSHASASSRPPPSAKPLMAAMIGCEQRSIIARYSMRLRRSRSWVGDAGSTNSRMSAPALNARSPAPVTTITFTSSSVVSAVKTWYISRRRVSFCALCTSGRLRVIVATCVSTAYRIVS